MVQLSGCGRNEWNATFGGSSNGEGGGRQRGRAGWSWSLQANNEQSEEAVLEEVSQDGIGTGNMVVMDKGELDRGRVSADIWAAHDGLRLAVSPTTAWACEPGPG